VTTGLKPGGCVLINTERGPEDFVELRERFRVATVDASAIAATHGIGSKSAPIVNTAILGAYAAVSGIVTLDSVCEAIGEEIPSKPEQNIAAAREAAGAVRVAEAVEVAHV